MVLQTSLTLHKLQNLLRRRWMMKKPSCRPSAQSISEKENKRKRVVRSIEKRDNVKRTVRRMDRKGEKGRRREGEEERREHNKKF